MKKILPFIILMCAFTFGAWAQTGPNRLIVTDKVGGYKGFMIERIDSIIFRTIDGRVAAEVEFKDFKTGETGDTIWLAIDKTPECWSYQIAVIPTNTMSYLSDEQRLASYIESQGGARYTQDFTNAQMTGFDFAFQADAEYTIATLGYDGYGVPCNTSTCTFRTPRPAVSGHPDVAATVEDVTTSSFTISFRPNEDVSTYSYCSFGLGEAESQFNMFGPMFGFATIEQMVYAWGIPCTGESTHTWTAMSPGKEYEVLIAVKDKNGNFADLISVPVTTTSLGGDGLAQIFISGGIFGGDSETGYYQQVVFTPNSEVAVYHALIVEKTAYDENFGGDDGMTSILQSPSNPFNPWDSYWDLYDEDDSTWNVDPATTYYAVAMGKNALGEWGPMSKVEITTPGVDSLSPKAKMARRHTVTTSAGVAGPKFGSMPKAMPSHSGIILK